VRLETTVTLAGAATAAAAGNDVSAVSPNIHDVITDVTDDVHFHYPTEVTDERQHIRTVSHLSCKLVTLWICVILIQFAL